MKSAFDMKSARIDALAVCLHTANLEELETFLQERTGRYQAFANMPFVLDLQEFSSTDMLNINGAVGMLKRHGLNITALRHNDEAFASAASKNHLAFVMANRNHTAEADVQAPEVPPKEEISSDNQSMQTTIINQPTVLVNTPIRTGQQVYAESADLIVTGVVSEGAEIIADGNIHVYGPMRGRALAGASGNRNARIFIHSMQAELVSVAGIYRNFEQDLPAHLHKQAVQVSLQDDRLAIRAIDVDSSY